MTTQGWQRTICLDTFYSIILSLPGLRGFWPMSSVDANGLAIDLSGHGGNLSPNGAPIYNLYNDNVAHATLDGIADSLSHADDPLYDITGTETFIAPAIQGLTAGCWIRHAALGSTKVYMGKYLSPPDASWLIAKDGSDAFRFSIVNASDLETVLSTENATIGPWKFIVGRFEPGIAISIFANDADIIQPALVKVTQPTLKTSINDSATLMHVGATDGGARFEGDITQCFLYTAALPDSVIDLLFQASKSKFGM